MCFILRGKASQIKGCLSCRFVTEAQKWNLQKSACDDGVKNELRLVLAKIGANFSFPGLKMLLNGL